MQKAKHLARLLGVVALSLATFLVIAGLCLYFIGLNRVTLAIASSLRVPVGMYSSQYITANELSDLLVAVEAKTGVKNNYGYLEQLFALEGAAKERVGVTEEGLSAAKKEVFSLDLDYQSSVSKFGEKIADRVYVLPFIYEAGLAEWYSRQDNLHQAESMKAQELLGELNSSDAWESLAKVLSEEGYSNLYGGDSGYVDLKKAIPEYRSQVESLPQREVNLVYSRYGIHVVEVLDRVETEDVFFTHLREILIKTPGFEDWLKNAKDEGGVNWFFRL